VPPDGEINQSSPLLQALPATANPLALFPAVTNWVRTAATAMHEMSICEGILQVLRTKPGTDQVFLGLPA